MLKIYLADLIYQTIKTNYVIPLNISCLAAYISRKLGNKVKISLFKYPNDLEKAIKNESPDVLGLSNYSWNTRLNSHFIEYVKKINPNVFTVMGGPNIRLESIDIEKYLRSQPNLNYYIIQEGEKPFLGLIKLLIKGKVTICPEGCAAIIKNRLKYKPVDFLKKPSIINYPSPYLEGWLDQFIKNPNMIPLLETNRGCPFGCAYCCWGVKAYCKIRQRPIEIVKRELDYLVDRSAGQVTWIFTDANFGIFPRDIEIAKKIREVMDRKGYPLNVILYHSKNTGDRNIEIAKITKANLGYIAIQSTDPLVLDNIGRGAIRLEDFKKQIAFYKSNNLGVATDILIGLPGETAKSHIKTLREAFDMGYDEINIFNIRLLKGSRYESDEYRKKYGVKTKFRPIFGSYGIFNSELIFEIEESVRGTKDMTENQMNDFKVIHWLIYFIWNVGIYKPYLRLIKKQGINPMKVILKLSKTKHTLLARLFKEMKDFSQDEWFESEEDIITFYKKRDNFDNMVKNFLKLNQLYIAKVYQDTTIMMALEEEIIRIIKYNLKIKIDPQLVDLSQRLISKDLLAPFKSIKKTYNSEIASLCLYSDVIKKNKIRLEIYRPRKVNSTILFHLKPNGEKDLSLANLTRFLEIGGMEMLLNKARVIK